METVPEPVRNSSRTRTFDTRVVFEEIDSKSFSQLFVDVVLLPLVSSRNSFFIRICEVEAVCTHVDVSVFLGHVSLCRTDEMAYRTQGTPAAFSALGFPLVVLTKGTPAAFSATGFLLVVLTQATPAAFSATWSLLSVFTEKLSTIPDAYFSFIHVLFADNPVRFLW